VATVDWAPWVAQIGRAVAEADAVVTIAYGADAIRMVQTWTEAGLKGKVPLYGGEAFVSEMLLPAMGAAAEGVRQLDSYCPALDTPENQDPEALVQALQRVRYVGPMGPFHYDDNHNPVLDAYVQEVRRIGAELHNTCVDKVAQLGHPGDIPFPPR